MRLILKGLMISLAAQCLALAAAAQGTEPMTAPEAGQGAATEFATPAHRALFDHLDQTQLNPPVAEVISAYPAMLADYPLAAAAAWRSAVLNAIDDASFYDSIFGHTVQALSEAEAQTVLDYAQSPAGEAVTAAERAFDENAIDSHARANAAIETFPDLPEAMRAPFDHLAALQFDAAVLRVQLSVLQAVYLPVLGETDTAAYLDGITPLLDARARDYMRAELYVTFRDLSPEDLAAHIAFLESQAGSAYRLALWQAFDVVYGQSMDQIGADFAAALAG